MRGFFAALRMLVLLGGRGRRPFAAANDNPPFHDKTVKGWGTQFSSTHLSDDEAVAKMGHPVYLCLLRQASSAAVGERSAKSFCAAMRPLPKAKLGDGKDFAMTCSSAPMSAMQSR